MKVFQICLNVFYNIEKTICFYMQNCDEYNKNINRLKSFLHTTFTPIQFNLELEEKIGEC